MNLDTPIELLTSVGKITAKRLKLLGLDTVQDLIFHFPFRYEDYSEVKPIKDLVAGDVVSVRAKIELIANRRSWKKKKMLTEVIVNDDTGSLKVLWFNQPYITKSLQAGDQVMLSGKVSVDNYGTTMVAPQYEKVRANVPTYNTGRMVPVYSLTAGVTEKQLRFLLKQCLPIIKNFQEILPVDFVKENGFISLAEALENIHFPRSDDMREKAEERLKFDEMFLIQLKIQKYRHELDEGEALKVRFLEKQTVDFVKKLPFELTDDQKKSSWEIIKDLEKGRPMNRLLEGDVGSGKTVVASLAILNVILSGYKAVLMAPTEILAVQHYNGLLKLFEGTKARIGLLTRTRKDIDGEKSTPKKMLTALESGEVDLVIGTHAVIQDKVKIKDLGLVIVDEQHRFGVKQRKSLTQKGEGDLTPHFLSMTATPIPRSLSLALYGDLDLSIINSMPKGRKPIITKYVTEDKRLQAYDFIKKQIKEGRQVFVVCPLIDPSDNFGFKSVTEEYEKLNEIVFPDLSIALLHGKLKAGDKTQVMQDFLDKKYDIVVSTSVIEVGVDVANATTMFIEGADRFGLSQLHQFRGRVGRGEHQSYCFLFTDNTSPLIKKRLEYFEKCGNGFDLAEKDLELRGSGQMYGTLQSGFPDVHIADLSDVNTIKKAQKYASLFWEKYELGDYEELRKLLEGKDVDYHFE